ncbi:MAG: hypothetical protein AAF327_18075 [Cyanobacteria bacterium P01_A01_bin.37]
MSSENGATEFKLVAVSGAPKQNKKPPGIQLCTVVLFLWIAVMAMHLSGDSPFEVRNNVHQEALPQE